MIERYTRPEMGAIWTDQARMDAWLKVELAGVEALAELAEKYRHLHVATVPGADHFYTEVRDEVVRQVEAWLRSLGY